MKAKSEEKRHAKPSVYNPDNGILRWIHIAIINATAFVLGTYYGLPSKYLDAYLDEYCFHFSGRSFGSNLFDRLAVAMSALATTDLKGRPLILAICNIC